MNYEEKDYQVYKEVSKIFADYILDRIIKNTEKTFIWIHDYHLFLVSKMVRESKKCTYWIFFTYTIPIIRSISSFTL
ncbi:MAG: hypothetical protein KatS3mg129_0504 [Leptospiraceae bacterium]|nr:MAG: hypothetical protein KatS3mg129_0504 [Leptospiraceae bacterium]